MNIKKAIIEPLQDNRQFRLEIALALDVSESTARRYILANSDELTKAAALIVLSKFTGLTNDQLLESTTAEKKD